jgi:hypothetical protein
MSQKFYRLPQFVAKGLAWYYNIPAVSTQDQINHLVRANRMSARNSRLFLDSMNQAARTRIRSHLETNRESDKVRTPASTDPNPDHEYVRTAGELTDLRATIGLLRRIRDLAQEFVRQKEKVAGPRRNPFIEN